MNKTIEFLASKMQKLLENNNGSLSGGFISVSQNQITGNGQNSNSKCIAAQTTNNHDCANWGSCDGTSNKGVCFNPRSCVGATNEGVSVGPWITHCSTTF